MCRILGGKNAYLNLVRARMEHGLINLGSPPLETKRFTPKVIFKLPHIFQEWYVYLETQVWLSREPVRGRVQQKILCFMLKDYSQ